MPTISCPGCGAAAAPDATSCAYCTRPLAALACGGCLARLFPGMAFCPFCGEAAARRPGAPTELACPGCADADRASLLHAHVVGDVTTLECRCCHGVWLDADAFDRLATERSARAPFAGTGSGTPATGGPLGPVRYRRCPACATIMHRENVARISGVIIDRCARHGVWFDVDELQRLVRFWESGGLDRARAREREQLAEERRRLEALRQLDVARTRHAPMPPAPRHTLSAELLALIGGIVRG